MLRVHSNSIPLLGILTVAVAMGFAIDLTGGELLIGSIPLDIQHFYLQFSPCYTKDPCPPFFYYLRYPSWQTGPPIDPDPPPTTTPITLRAYLVANRVRTYYDSCFTLHSAPAPVYYMPSYCYYTYVYFATIYPLNRVEYDTSFDYPLRELIPYPHPPIWGPSWRYKLGPKPHTQGPVPIKYKRLLLIATLDIWDLVFFKLLTAILWTLITQFWDQMDPPALSTRLLSLGPSYISQHTTTRGNLYPPPYPLLWIPPPLVFALVRIRKCTSSNMSPDKAPFTHPLFVLLAPQDPSFPPPYALLEDHSPLAQYKDYWTKPTLHPSPLPIPLFWIPQNPLTPPTTPPWLDTPPHPSQAHPKPPLLSRDPLTTTWIGFSTTMAPFGLTGTITPITLTLDYLNSPDPHPVPFWDVSVQTQPVPMVRLAAVFAQSIRFDLTLVPPNTPGTPCLYSPYQPHPLRYPVWIDNSYVTPWYSIAQGLYLCNPPTMEYVPMMPPQFV
ncbi:hypothetical protein G9A89_000687 [Geosiphon pyriformis]|nr:hypothetical protein G9A89_000687 [Geosiphon pyriformis]